MRGFRAVKPLAVAGAAPFRRARSDAATATLRHARHVDGLLELESSYLDIAASTMISCRRAWRCAPEVGSITASSSTET